MVRQTLTDAYVIQQCPLFVPPSAEETRELLKVYGRGMDVVTRPVSALALELSLASLMREGKMKKGGYEGDEDMPDAPEGGDKKGYEAEMPAAPQSGKRDRDINGEGGEDKHSQQRKTGARKAKNVATEASKQFRGERGQSEKMSGVKYSMKDDINTRPVKTRPKTIPNVDVNITPMKRQAKGSADTTEEAKRTDPVPPFLTAAQGAARAFRE